MINHKFGMELYNNKMPSGLTSLVNFRWGFISREDDYVCGRHLKQVFLDSWKYYQLKLNLRPELIIKARPTLYVMVVLT